MPLEALFEAGEKLIEGLNLMMPGAQIETVQIESANRYIPPL